jgi:transcriptional regulator GlxA family with amidase domain
MNQLAMSARTLRRMSHRYLGMGPKRFLSVVRINNAIRSLVTARRAKLADIAALHGYTDQAHMSRDFRRLTRAWPSDYLPSVVHREYDEFMAVGEEPTDTTTSPA